MSSILEEATIKQNTIIRKIQEKNTEAFTQLYINYSPALLGIISSIIHQEEIAQEVLQDTFVKIWSQSTTYNPEKGRLFTWMARIARNMSIDCLRSKTYKNGKRTSTFEQFDDLERVKGFDMKLSDPGLQNTMALLDKKYIDVLGAIYYEGRTQKQTSQKLNISLGTVKTRSRKGLQIMNKLLLEEKYLCF